MSFVKLPILRGFLEIKEIFEVCQKMNSFICGGYVRYCVSPHPTSKVAPAVDVDLFPQAAEVDVQLKNHFLSLGFAVKHENEISITLKVPTELKHKYGHWPRIQIIKPLIKGAIQTVGTMEEILSNFDFTVVRCGILSESEALADIDFIKDETERNLKFKNIHCPISSLLRAIKYSKKGYWLRPVEALKLFINWSARSQDYRDRIIELLFSTEKKDSLSKEEVEELEALMRID